jgi:hypothetical protein
MRFDLRNTHRFVVRAQPSAFNPGFTTGPPIDLTVCFKLAAEN